ncbi:ZrgA family zinc uptake protein [Endozoicomonas sp. ALC020]|uniref:ZrgA family zinc uptake protein n=1 Tax=unclassified Endozoicomonas TaxID=2644528 RepID=UPI003BB09D1E
MQTFTKLAAGIACGVLSLTVYSANGEQRHVDAHVHGQGELNFAVEGSEIHLELKMPANDVLGFETITTDKQRHQLHEALEKLEAASLWSMTPAASCKLVSAKATSSSVDHDHGREKAHNDDHGHHEKDHNRHDHHDEHASHGHDDEHDHHGEHASDDHHDDHHGEHNHEEHESESGHMDISATYVFECGNANQLNTISTSIFETFERSESLSVQGFTQKGQMAAEMTKSKPEVRF